ncbi:MAG: hypothetical protein AAFV93_07980 [Chloroflexota bacterium]
MEEKTLAQADREAKNIINNWTVGAALLGWVPGSTVLFTAADTAMITQVANVYEVSAFDMEHLTSTLTASLASAVASGVIVEGIGLVPVIGWAIKSAAMATKATFIGNEVQKYFRKRSPLKSNTIDVEIE